MGDFEPMTSVNVERAVSWTAASILYLLPQLVIIRFSILRSNVSFERWMEKSEYFFSVFSVACSNGSCYQLSLSMVIWVGIFFPLGRVIQHRFIPIDNLFDKILISNAIGMCIVIGSSMIISILTGFHVTWWGTLLIVVIIILLPFKESDARNGSDERNRQAMRVESSTKLLDSIIMIFCCCVILFTLYLRLLLFTAQNHAHSDVGEYVVMIDDLVSSSWYWTYDGPWAPAYPHAAAIFSSFGIDSFLAMKSISMISSLLTPVYLLGIIRTRFKMRSVHCMIFLMICYAFPLSIIGASFALQDMMMALFVVASVYVYCLILRNKPTSLWILLGCLLGIGYLLRYSQALAIVVIFFLSLSETQAEKRWLPALLFCTGVALTIGPWMLKDLIRFGELIHTSDTGLFKVEDIGPNWSDFSILFLRYISLAPLIFFVLSCIINQEKFLEYNSKFVLVFVAATVLTFLPIFAFHSMQERYFLAQGSLLMLGFVLIAMDYRALLALSGYLFWALTVVCNFGQDHWFVKQSITTVPDPVTQVSVMSATTIFASTLLAVILCIMVLNSQGRASSFMSTHE